MPGSVQLALTNAASEPHNIDAQYSYFDPFHVPYENFAIESIEIAPHGNADFGRGIRFKLLNHAEYICGAYLEVTLPEIEAPTDSRIAWVHNIGIYMFNDIEFKVNNNQLDILYPEYIDICTRLTLPEGKRKGWNDMIGEANFTTKLLHSRYAQVSEVDDRAPQVAAATKAQFKIILPLRFWWCMEWSQALPIGILVFCELWIHVNFKRAEDLYKVYLSSDGSFDPATMSFESGSRAVTTPRIVECKCYVDYVYLPTDARDRIAQGAHFYFIKQCKHTGPVTASASSLQHKLPLVLPTETLLFAFREAAATTDREYHFFDKYHGNAGDVTDGTVTGKMPDALIDTVTLKILSTDRQTARGHLYHGRYLPMKHNTSIPESRGIGQWQFALNPEMAQASGVCNFSSSEQNYLNFTFNQGAAVDGTSPSGVGVGGRTADMYLFGISSNYIYIANGYLTMLYNA